MVHEKLGHFTYESVNKNGDKVEQRRLNVAMLLVNTVTNLWLYCRVVLLTRIKGVLIKSCDYHMCRLKKSSTSRRGDCFRTRREKSPLFLREEKNNSNYKEKCKHKNNHY